MKSKPILRRLSSLPTQLLLSDVSYPKEELQLGTRNSASKREMR